jgi:hypothetical protein
LRNFYLFRINCHVLGVRLPLHVEVGGRGDGVGRGTEVRAWLYNTIHYITSGWCGNGNPKDTHYVHQKTQIMFSKRHTLCSPKDTHHVLIDAGMPSRRVPWHTQQVKPPRTGLCKFDAPPRGVWEWRGGTDAGAGKDGLKKRC